MLASGLKWVLVALVAFLANTVFADDATSMSVEACRAAGFDSYQLSCGTCDLLPQGIVDTCQSCCLSYRTLEKRTQRYQAAVLTHTLNVPHFFPEIHSMVTEDWKDLIQQKGRSRLILRDISDQPQAPTIFWFQELPHNAASMPIYQLEQLAPETVNLYGWKRDDVREMLKAILPDQGV